MGTHSTIIETYLQHLEQGKTNKSPDAKEDDFLSLLKEVRKNQGEHLIPISYYLNLIEITNPLLFKYMSIEKQQTLRRALQIAYLYLLAQQEHEQNNNIYTNRSLYIESLKRCDRLLDALNPNKQNRSPEQEQLLPGKPIKYIGFWLGKEVTEDMLELVDNQTEDLIKQLNVTNEGRLYWIWASSFLKTGLSALPPNFFHTADANTLAYSLDPYSGTLSWVLYYFRFAINLYLLVECTWGTKEEGRSLTELKDRFLTQWNMRKFALLNDALWATCNMVCFIWLNAKNGLGPWGDLFTLALLVFDISLVVWGFQEQQTEYNQKILQCAQDLKVLNDAIKTTQTDLYLDEDSKYKKIKEYRLQINDLIRARTALKNDWEFKNQKLRIDLCYAMGLLIAFSLLTLPFLPITGPAVLAISAVGALLCFTFSVLYSGVQSSIDIKKSQADAQAAHKECLEKIALFKEGQSLIEGYEGDTLTQKMNELKLLFLEIKQLKAESNYQQQRVALQTIHLYRSIMMQVLTPFIIFACLVFPPLCIGLPVLGVVVAMMLYTNKLINDTYKPMKEALTDFPEEAFNTCLKDPAQLDEHNFPSKNVFFKPHQGKKSDPLLLGDGDDDSSELTPGSI
ncbi:MAG: hypothetical protein ACHP6H_00600 [Legionellales bacterium]